MCREAITYVKISVGAAGGFRPWIAAKSPARLTPARPAPEAAATPAVSGRR
jgi:hypothetical protein